MIRAKVACVEQEPHLPSVGSVTTGIGSVILARMVDCEGLPHPRALVGIYLLNQRKYFEAHEELEAAWRDEQGRIRELYQGILEAAVTYLHIQRGNYAGAIKVYGRSMRWLNGWQNTCRGIDVEQLRTDLKTVMAEVKRLGESKMAEFDHDLLKPVIWKEGPDGG